MQTYTRVSMCPCSPSNHPPFKIASFPVGKLSASSVSAWCLQLRTPSPASCGVPPPAVPCEQLAGSHSARLNHQEMHQFELLSWISLPVGRGQRDAQRLADGWMVTAISGCFCLSLSSCQFTLIFPLLYNSQDGI